MAHTISETFHDFSKSFWHSLTINSLLKSKWFPFKYVLELGDKTNSQIVHDPDLVQAEDVGNLNGGYSTIPYRNDIQSCSSCVCSSVHYENEIQSCDFSVYSSVHYGNEIQSCNSSIIMFLRPLYFLTLQTYRKGAMQEKTIQLMAERNMLPWWKMSLCFRFRSSWHLV